jgi:hypothetical protein
LRVSFSSKMGFSSASPSIDATQLEGVEIEGYVK